MPSKSKVCFFFEVKKIALKDRTRLKSFIGSIFRKHGLPLSYINYIFCSDKRLRSINRDFLKHDYYTDIITFPLSEGGPLEAEIYISVDRVRENALDNKVSFKEELHRVIFHGALHLCGYSDKNPTQTREMRAQEELWLGKYFR
jgi:rRNA maturation RNase YbeY